jgi:hypothetical protein
MPPSVPVSPSLLRLVPLLTSTASVTFFFTQYWMLIPFLQPSMPPESISKFWNSYIYQTIPRMSWLPPPWRRDRAPELEAFFWHYMDLVWLGSRLYTLSLRFWTYSMCSFIVKKEFGRDSSGKTGSLVE